MFLVGAISYGSISHPKQDMNRRGIVLPLYSVPKLTTTKQVWHFAAPSPHR